MEKELKKLEAQLLGVNDYDVLGFISFDIEETNMLGRFKFTPVHRNGSVDEDLSIFVTVQDMDSEGKITSYKTACNRNGKIVRSELEIY